MEGTTLSVHEGGLARVLSEWSGIGSLYSAVAAATATPVEREWSPQDVERRAMRILLLQCSPAIRRWPKSAKEWQNYLPTLSNRHRFWSEAPQTRVDWAKTRRAGWPPASFAIRRRRRSPDQLTLSVLAWTLSKLDDAIAASQSLTGPHTGPVIEQLSADVEDTLFRTLPLLGLLDEADQTPPTRDDIRSVRASGWPWNVVAEVAGYFAALERGGAPALARKLLRPDGFPEAIFQLSVLGAVLIACERAGATLTSLRPIGYMTSGPVYRITFLNSEPWDLWCEAARCWDEYGIDDKYRELSATLVATTGQAYQARNIRPDVLLARRGDRAMVLECKYPGESLDPGYVAHGMYQAAFYAHQLKPAFDTVNALAVGPTDLVPSHASTWMGSIQVGLASPVDLETILMQFLNADGAGNNSRQTE